MTELNVLEGMCWIGVILGIAAFWYAVRSIYSANGTRPVLMMLAFIASWVVLYSIIITDLTYGLEQINSTGHREAEVFFMRFFSWPVSIGLIWLKWKNDHMAHPLHPGPATVSIPAVITQENIDSGEVRQ